MPVFFNLGLQYLHYLESLSISDFLNPFKEKKFEILDFAFCNTWSPPVGGDDCDLCSSHPMRPCSEYRCHSLGEECIYEEIEGVSQCYKRLSSTTPPQVDRNNRRSSTALPKCLDMMTDSPSGMVGGGSTLDGPIDKIT